MKFTEEQQKHITLMNNILQEIANRKLPAYLKGRRKARDLHDIIFLAEHYYYEFSEESRKKLVDIANDDDLLYEYITDYSNDSILKNSFFTDIARLKDLTSKCREIDLEKEFSNNPYSQDYCEVPDTDTDSKNTNINKSFNAKTRFAMRASKGDVERGLKLLSELKKHNIAKGLTKKEVYLDLKPPL